MSVDLDKMEATAEVDPSWTAYTVPRINLLPPEIEAERRLRKTQGILGGVAMGVVALLAGGFVLSVAAVNQAEEGLATEQNRTLQLQTEEGRYAEVPKVLAQVEEAQSARALAMFSDVKWFDYLHNVAATYPEDVWLSDMTATVAASSASATSGALPTDPLATPGMGTVSFSGTALRHSDVATWLDVLAATDGFADPSFSSSARSEIGGQTVVNFSSSVVVTVDARWARHDRKAS